MLHTICHCMHAKSFQSCPALRDPVDFSLPGSSVHGDSPGKNTVVGCHILLWGIFLIQGSYRLLYLLRWQEGSSPLAPPGKSSNVVAAAAAKLLRLCLTLCDPIDGSPPGSPISGILQARTLEWVAISFSSA